MEPGFLLNDKEKDKKMKKIELRQKLKRKILEKQSKRNGKPTKKQMQKFKKKINKRDEEMKMHLTGEHSSENIYNHVLYLMTDLEKYKNNKDRLSIAKSLEEKHSFLHKNYFNIYREVCYERLTDLRLLKKLLDQRDLQMNKDKTEEETAQEVGKILTEKFVKKEELEKFEEMAKEDKKTNE